MSHHLYVNYVSFGIYFIIRFYLFYFYRLKTIYLRKQCSFLFCVWKKIRIIIFFLFSFSIQLFVDSTKSNERVLIFFCMLVYVKRFIQRFFFRNTTRKFLSRGLFCSIILVFLLFNSMEIFHIPKY